MNVVELNLRQLKIKRGLELAGKTVFENFVKIAFNRLSGLPGCKL